MILLSFYHQLFLLFIPFAQDHNLLVNNTMDPLPTILASQLCQAPLSYDTLSVLAIVSSSLGLLWAGYNFLMLRRVELQPEQEEEDSEEGLTEMPDHQRKLLMEFGYKTYDAAFQFLKLEYLFCLVLVLVAFLLLWFLTELGLSCAIAFLVGALLSLATSLMALLVSTRAAPRVAFCSRFGMGATFRTSYQAASVIGFGIASLNLLALTVIVEIFKQEFDLSTASADSGYFRKLFQAVAGYGLGASLVALVTRTGGGMFQGATETGSELIGKTEGALPLSHSRNAATISLHAGHQVEGIVGAASDMNGSYTELICVSFLLASTSLIGWDEKTDSSCGVNLTYVVLPLLLMSFGLVASLVASIAGTIVVWVEVPGQLITTIRNQRLISSILTAGLFFLGTYLSLPDSFKLEGVTMLLNPLHAHWEVYLCALVGVLAYLTLGFFCYQVNSPSLPFIKSLTSKCRKGPAASVTLGIAFGYLASLGPAILVCLVTFYGYEFLGFYGISISILGLLSTFPLQLALQSLSPVASSAAMSVSIAGLGDDQKDVTASLAEAGEAASIVSRGINVGCSSLVGIMLLGGYLRNAGLDSQTAEDAISLTDPYIFSGMLIGGVLPFALSGLVARGSRKAVAPLIQQIQNQLKEDDGIAREESEVDYGNSVRPASIKIHKHLMAPVLVTILLPMIFGFAFSPEIVAGMLPGLIVSGFQFSCSTSLSGEAWRAARRQVEKGEVVDEDGRVHGVGSMAHRAATIGSSVGVMIKKNASCSVSSALRLIGMLAVLFGSKFAQIHS